MLKSLILALYPLAATTTVIEIFDSCRAGGYPCAKSLAEAASHARVPGACEPPCTITFRNNDEQTGLPKILGAQHADNLHGTKDNPITISTAIAAKRQVLEGSGNASSAGRNTCIIAALLAVSALPFSACVVGCF